MHRDRVVAILRDHADELRALGIRRLTLFGSTARNEATAASDVDLAAEFDDSARTLSLLDIVRIENRLADLLGTPVDLAEASALGRVQAELSRDGILVLA